MKALINTLHFYNNYGSVLQAYALRESLKKYLHIDADIFLYRPQIKEWSYFTDRKLQEEYDGKKKKFDCFRKDFLGIECDDKDDVAQAFESMSRTPDDYDVYIVGSDIVWGREFSNLDPVYFLRHAKGSAKKIAYAASVRINERGQTEDDEMFRHYLQDFNAISVREKSSIRLISELAQSSSVINVIDPTFLLNSEDYADLEVETADMKGEPYILSYFLTHSPAVVDYTNIIARKLGFRVIHFWADYPDNIFKQDSSCFAFTGPGEFLGYIKNATLVFTNSFHGTCFSILYRKPFYTYMGKRGLLSRVQDMVTTFNLEDRCFYDFTDISRLSLDIDYSFFDGEIIEERRKAISFLKEVIS